MKRFVLIFSATVILPVLLSSCASFRKQPEVRLREFSRQDENAARTLAGTFAESFIQALKNDDFSIWQKHIPPRSANRISQQNFKDMRKELLDNFGTFTGGTSLGEVTSGDLRTYLWKLTFEAKDKNKKTVREIIYFVRVFCEEGKAPAISRFGVKII